MRDEPTQEEKQAYWDRLLNDVADMEVDGEELYP